MLEHSRAASRHVATVTPLISEDRVVPHLVHVQHGAHLEDGTTQTTRGSGFRMEDSEAIVATIRPHWTIMLPTFGVLVGIPLLLLLPFGPFTLMAHQLIAIGFVGACLMLVVGVRTWRADCVEITTETVIHTRGGIGRHVRELPLVDITDLSVKQDAVERFMGAGTLRIDIHSGTPEILTHISNPVSVQELLLHQVERKAKELYSSSTTAPGSDEPDVVTELERLHELQALGAITPAEYQLAKDQLLKSL